MNRKQIKSTLHTRGNLRDRVEVPLEEAPPPEEAKEPLPERRVPYSLHIISHFPNNKHLKEESTARIFIEEKIVDSLEILEDMIRHVEVNLQVSEGFHHGEKTQFQVKSLDTDNDVDPVLEVEQRDPGSRLVTPYIFKVTVTLKNDRTIVLANAEKHAQPTLTEGLDHMLDVIRKSLREEKDKDIQAKKKLKFDADMVMEDDGDEFDILESATITEELDKQDDVMREQMYRSVEEAIEK